MQNIIIINNNKISFSWQWVKSSDLITNQNQTRNRHDLGSQSQINSIATNLIPELLAQSFDISTGAPVIDDQNNIISGHGRIEAIKMAYYNHIDNYIKYINYCANLNKLPDNKGACYVLCRVIAKQHNTIDAVHSANNTTLSYTPYELAKINAKRLKPTINDFITSLPLFEQAQYFTNSILNNKAYDDYQAAQIIKALPSCEIMQDFINYPNADYKNVISAILDNIQIIMHHQQNNTNIYQALILALDKFLQVKKDNGDINDFLLQLDIFDDRYNDADFSNILTILWNNTRSAKKLAHELGYILNRHNVPDLFADDDILTNKIINTMPEIFTPSEKIDNINTIRHKLELEPIAKPQPHEWQNNALDSLDDALLHDQNRILISAATGAGKAFLLMFIIDKMIKSNKRVLLLVDRIKLVQQLCEDANTFNFSYNLIQGDNRIINDNNLLTIASVQSFFKQSHNLEFDYIIQDECHSQFTALTDHLKKFQGVAIGCTATPTSKGLKNIYTHLIETVTHNELINSGVLTPLVIKEHQQIDMTTAKIIAGEWASSDVVENCQVGFDNWIIYNIISHIDNSNTPLRAIAFCANIEHCQELKRRLNKVTRCAVYTSMQNETERKNILEDYDNKIINVLITVATLSKGFNRKDITTIIDLRPLRKSIAEYVQIIGRGTRAMSGKTSCTILDFTGNWSRFKDKVMEMQSNGVKSLYDNTLDTKMMHTSQVSNKTSQALKNAASDDTKQNNSILDILRLRTRSLVHGTTPPHPQNLFDKFLNLFRSN